MVCSRAEDFCYSELEIRVMERDIQLAKNAGCDGVVFGLLGLDGTIDVERTKRLLDVARPLSMTFHRAFDLTPDPPQALEALIRLGVDRVLTSGQEATALEGIALISKFVEAAQECIIVMPGGGVERGLEEIVRRSGVREVHLSARKTLPSSVPPNLALEEQFSTLQIVDRERITEIKARLARV
jgi:copper homeostasis protein